MTQDDISREQWHGFCDEFSREHQGWLVTLATADPMLDAVAGAVATRVLAHDLPLRGITVEESDGGAAVVVVTGIGTAHLAHRVEAVSRISFDQTAGGAHRGLVIDGAREKVRLRFRSAALPESLDGLADSERP